VYPPNAGPQQISGRCCRVWLPDCVLPAGEKLRDALEGKNGANFQHLNRKHVGATFRVFGHANPDVPPWKRLQVVAQCHMNVNFDNVEADLLDLAETACDIVADSLHLTDDQVQQAFDDIRYERTDIKLTVPKGGALPTGSLANFARPPGIPNAATQGSVPSSFSKASLQGTPPPQTSFGATQKAPGAAPPAAAHHHHHPPKAPVLAPPAGPARTSASTRTAAAAGAPPGVAGAGIAGPQQQQRKEKRGKEKKEKKGTPKEPLSDVRQAEKELSKTRLLIQKRLESEEKAQATASSTPSHSDPNNSNSISLTKSSSSGLTSMEAASGTSLTGGSSSSSSGRAAASKATNGSSVGSSNSNSNSANNKRTAAKAGLATSAANPRRQAASTTAAALPGTTPAIPAATTAATAATPATSAAPEPGTNSAQKTSNGHLVVSQKPDEFTEDQKLMPPPPLPPPKRQKIDTEVKAGARIEQPPAAMSVDNTDEESDDGEESEEEEDLDEDEEMSSSEEAEEGATNNAEPTEGGTASFDPIRVQLSKLGERCCVAFACFAGGNPGPELLTSSYSIDQRVKLEHCKDDIQAGGDIVTIWKFVASTSKKHREGMAALCDYFKSKQRVGMVVTETYKLYMVPPDPAFLKGVNLLDPSLAEQQEGCILGVQVPHELLVEEEEGEDAAAPPQ